MKLLLSIVILIIVNSCNYSIPEDINIQGTWFSYDIEETEYSEYDIDSNRIGRFSHYGGNSGLRDYKISKDTLYYLNGKIKLKVISENQFSMTSRGRTDTLTRLPDSIITYNLYDHKNDSIFDDFYRKFERRAYKKWLTYGYITIEQYDEHFSITTKQ